MYVRHERHPDLPPPVVETGVIGWLRANLFSSVTNTLLTLLGVSLVYLIVPPFLRWAVIDANWAGTTREECHDALGACWVFIKVRFPLLMYGFFPESERWRIDLTGLLLAGATAPLLLAPFLPFPERINRLVLRAIPAASALTAFGLYGMGPGLTAALFLGAPFVLARLGAAPSEWTDRLSARLPMPRLCLAVAAGLVAGALIGFSDFGGARPLGGAVGLTVLLI